MMMTSTYPGMMMTSTCPDNTCKYRTKNGFCSQTVCMNQKSITVSQWPVETCQLCKYDLDDGDYLYQRNSQDHAMVFEEIVVHYCPVCGRKLKGR